jgi:D-glycero-D-manno-heptose 1,7-bisphosphate phosphatase
MTLLTKKYKLIALDRDGVINEDSPDYIKSPAEWLAIPGSLEGIARLNKAGLKIALISNQSGLARGYFDFSALAAINFKMLNELAKVGGHFDGIFYCPHHPNDNCLCRKPNPKMLFQAMEQLKACSNEVLMVGDTMRDIQLARNVGCDAFLVKTGQGMETRTKHGSDLAEIKVFSSLKEVCENLLSAS